MLIGFIGIRKDTENVAEYLFLKYKFRKFRFLDHVKHLCSRLYELPFFETEFEDVIFPNFDLTPNQILSQVESYLRYVQPTIFQSNLIVDTTENVVVLDVLYPEDAHRIKNLGGIIIRLREKGNLNSLASDLRSDYVIEFSNDMFEKCDEVIFSHFSQTL